MRAPLLSSALALSLAACTEGSAEDTAVEIVLPDLSDGWSEIQPGGETTCSRGAEFGFFVHPGTVNKVVVEFQGGGACWDEFTCGFADAIFSDDMDWMRAILDLEDFPGIYDHSDPENPLKDWYHVLVPYCTGDIHWGDSTTTYGEGTDDEVTIEHKGAVNARAVLDWVEDNFSAPESIVSTGCSAGAYGSIMWAPYLVEMFPDARTVQLGDSGAGVVTEGWFDESFPSWNPDGAFPAWIPDLDPATTDYAGLALPDLYERIGAYYPDLPLGQFNTIQDWNQILYYEAMGGSAEGWSGTMQQYVDRIATSTPNFKHFLAPGDQHCVIPDDSFFSMTSDGVQIDEWLMDRVEGVEVDNVTCEECAE